MILKVTKITASGRKGKSIPYEFNSVDAAITGTSRIIDNMSYQLINKIGLNLPVKSEDGNGILVEFRPACILFNSVFYHLELTD